MNNCCVNTEKSSTWKSLYVSITTTQTCHVTDPCALSSMVLGGYGREWSLGREKRNMRDAVFRGLREWSVGGHGGWPMGKLSLPCIEIYHTNTHTYILTHGKHRHTRIHVHTSTLTIAYTLQFSWGKGRPKFSFSKRFSTNTLTHVPM